MAYSVPGRCPVCGDELMVTRLHCRRCDTTLDGRFDLGLLANLTAEQLRFAELFIRCEGKLTRVGDELDLSYPTVRSRLNDLIRALGYEISDDGQPSDTERRLDILNELSAGNITPEKAVKLLKQA